MARQPQVVFARSRQRGERHIGGWSVTSVVDRPAATIFRQPPDPRVGERVDFVLSGPADDGDRRLDRERVCGPVPFRVDRVVALAAAVSDVAWVGARDPDVRGIGPDGREHERNFVDHVPRGTFVQEDRGSAVTRRDRDRRSTLGAARGRRTKVSGQRRSRTNRPTNTRLSRRSSSRRPRRRHRCR